MMVSLFELFKTGLHWAAKRGNLEIALKLLNFGADPDA
jgi:ankyrin repeat protein